MQGIKMDGSHFGDSEGTEREEHHIFELESFFPSTVKGV